MCERLSALTRPFLRAHSLEQFKHSPLVRTTSVSGGPFSQRQISPTRSYIAPALLEAATSVDVSMVGGISWISAGQACTNAEEIDLILKNTTASQATRRAARMSASGNFNPSDKLMGTTLTIIGLGLLGSGIAKRNETQLNAVNSKIQKLGTGISELGTEIAERSETQIKEVNAKIQHLELEVALKPFQYNRGLTQQSL